MVWVISGIVVLGAVVWVRWVVQRMNGSKGPSVSERRRRRPILRNPILWIYVLTTAILLTVVAWALNTMSY